MSDEKVTLDEVEWTREPGVVDDEAESWSARGGDVTVDELDESWGWIVWRTYWDRDAGPMGEEVADGEAPTRDEAMRAAVAKDDELQQAETEAADAEAKFYEDMETAAKDR